MAQGRLNRDQFGKLAEMEATDLKKALWTLVLAGRGAAAGTCRGHQ